MGFSVQHDVQGGEHAYKGASTYKVIEGGALRVDDESGERITYAPSAWYRVTDDAPAEGELDDKGFVDPNDP